MAGADGGHRPHPAQLPRAAPGARLAAFASGATASRFVLQMGLQYVSYAAAWWAQGFGFRLQNLPGPGEMGEILFFEKIWKISDEIDKSNFKF